MLVEQQKDVNYLLYAFIVTCIGLIGAIIYRIVSKLFIGAYLTKSLKVVIQFFCMILSFGVGMAFFCFFKTLEPLLLMSTSVWFGALVAQFVSILIIETVEEIEPNIVIKIVKEK